MDVKKFIRDIFTNLIANLLILAGGVLVIILAFFQRLPPYQLLLLIIGIIGLVFWTINQIDAWRERHKNGFSSQTDEQIKKTIEGWCLKQGHGVQENPQPNARFQFISTNLQGKPVVISRYKELPELIRLWVPFIIPQDAISRFNVLPEFTREEIMQQCQIEMARFGVQWKGLSNPLGVVELIEHMRCDDSLTEFNFLNGVTFMVNAQVLLHATMALHIKQAERSVKNSVQQDSHTEAPSNL